MAVLSIRGLDDGVRERLRIRAAQHGRSMEAEIRDILSTAVADGDPQQGLFTMLRERFADLGGVDLELPPRRTQARAAKLS